MTVYVEVSELNFKTMLATDLQVGSLVTDNMGGLYVIDYILGDSAVASRYLGHD